MNILILVDCYHPIPKSSSQLISDLAKEFIDKGHSTAVVTPNSEYGKTPTVSTEDGIEVVRIGAGATKGAPLWLRGINEARLSSTLWSRCAGYFSSRRFDLIVFYSPSIFFAPLVARLKKLYSCPAYLIIRDIFPQWAVDAGILSKGIPYLYFKRRELQQYRVADIIGVQSKANLGYFSERNLAQDKPIEVLHNWLRVPPPPRATSDLIRTWGLHEKTILFYGGNIGVAQDCDNLLRLGKHLAATCPDAAILLVGDGSEVPRLTRIIEAESIRNVHIHPSISQEKYLELLTGVQVGLISLSRSLRTHNFPAKLLGYMNASLPILASINPGNDLGEVIESNAAGIVVQNGDDPGLLQGATRLIQDPELRRAMGTNSRLLMDKVFSAPVAAAKILNSVAGLRTAP